MFHDSWANRITYIHIIFLLWLNNIYLHKTVCSLDSNLQARYKHDRSNMEAGMCLRCDSDTPFGQHIRYLDAYNIIQMLNKDLLDSQKLAKWNQ